MLEISLPKQAKIASRRSKRKVSKWLESLPEDIAKADHGQDAEQPASEAVECRADADQCGEDPSDAEQSGGEDPSAAEQPGGEVPSADDRADKPAFLVHKFLNIKFPTLLQELTKSTHFVCWSRRSIFNFSPKIC